MPFARFSCLLVCLTLVAGVAVGDESAKAELSPELKKLIQQLDADDFADRSSASEQLAKLGKEALPALEEGVRSDSPEAATRSFELLQQLFEKGDAAARSAAKSSLEKLAQSDDRVASQAKKLLEPKQTAVDPNQNGIRVLGGGIRIFGGRIARAAIPVPVEVAGRVEVRAASSISVSVVDGVKTINVDNDGKKIKIVDDPKKGIEGEYTETKDGKETTHKFAAKNEEELKTKHPDAFKLYEQYAKGGGVRVEAVAVGGFRPAVPAAARLPQDRIQELLKKLDEQIATATKELAVATEEKDPRAAIMAKRLESYARLRERYAEQLKAFEAKEAAADAIKEAEAVKAAEAIKEGFKLELEVTE